MARRRGGRTPRGGGRGRRGREEPVAEEVLEFAEPERPARAGRRGPSGGSVAGGPGIGVVIPLVTTLVAAIMLIASGFAVSSASSKAIDGTFEDLAIGIAQGLSIVEPSWWETNHGIEPTVYEVVNKKKDERIAKGRATDPEFDEVEETVIKNEFKEFQKKWGVTEPAQAELMKRTDLQNANRERLARLVKLGGAIQYASITRAGGETFRYSANQMPAGLRYGQPRKVGEATVWTAVVGSLPARIVSYPIVDAFGTQAGTVKIIATSRAAAGGAGSMVVIMALVGILLVGGVAFGLCFMAAKGIGSLARELDQVARGDLDVRIRPGGGEIGVLARAVDRALKTFRSVQEQALMTPVQPVSGPADASVDTTALLPSEAPRVDGYEIEAVHKPCLAGANDFYDYIMVDDHHLGVVIADMPQQGPSGAFIATTFRALMRAHAPGDHSPASVLGKVNRVMASELKRGDHITALYAILDTQNGIVSVASAGHLPLVFWKLEKRGSALLNPEGIAIGLDKGPVFEKTVVDKRIKLEKGDRYVLYTDGPVAAKNASGEEFGEQRFYYVVSREAPKNSAAFVNFVANEVDLFHEGAIQEDDITIVTVRKVS